MADVLTYFDRLREAMSWLGSKPDTVFLGQAVKFPGTAIYKTLSGVPENIRIEMPVCEDLQMGASIGLSLSGFVPISIYPRWDFLVCATNQLVNHLDKLTEMTQGEASPKVIIRTCIGSKVPLNPGPQHSSDYTEAFSKMLRNVEVIRLYRPDEILPAYQKAYEREDGKATLLVERADSYNDEDK